MNVPFFQPDPQSGIIYLLSRQYKRDVGIILPLSLRSAIMRIAFFTAGAQGDVQRSIMSGRRL